jgi:hypothetical protein
MAKTKRTFRKINKRNKKNNKSKKRVSKRSSRKMNGGESPEEQQQREQAEHLKGMDRWMYDKTQLDKIRESNERWQAMLKAQGEKKEVPLKSEELLDSIYRDYNKTYLINGGEYKYLGFRIGTWGSLNSFAYSPIGQYVYSDVESDKLSLIEKGCVANGKGKFYQNLGSCNPLYIVNPIGIVSIIE